MKVSIIYKSQKKWKNPKSKLVKKLSEFVEFVKNLKLKATQEPKFVIEKQTFVIESYPSKICN